MNMSPAASAQAIALAKRERAEYLQWWYEHLHEHLVTSNVSAQDARTLLSREVSDAMKAAFVAITGDEAEGRGIAEAWRTALAVIVNELPRESGGFEFWYFEGDEPQVISYLRWDD